MFKYGKSKLSFFKPFVATLFISAIFLPLSHAKLSSELSNGDQLNLIGIGIHQELRNDIYIGALFGPSSVSDAELLLDDSFAKRMSIRFISKYANRKLSRHWKERLALNNPRDKWQPLTRDIIQFSEIFKSNFEVGDELNIDYIPGLGTQIYLNGTYFKTIATPDFYNLLLNVWLGTNPPTKAFKNSIRGLDEASEQDKMTEKYQNLVSIAGRFDQDLIQNKIVASEVTQEIVAKEPVKVATLKPEQTEKKKDVKEAKKDNKKEISPTLADNTKARVSQEKLNEQASDKTKIAKTLDDNKPDIVEEAKKSSLNNVATQTELSSSLIGTHVLETPKLENINTDLTINKSVNTNKEKPKEPEPLEVFFDADLAAGSYTRDLIDAVRKYQEYPRQALIDGDEGTVVAKVTIDTSGEVLEIELVEKSGSRTLDRAVIKMVNKASPFQAIPAELKLQTFDFELPITFQL